jgi:hypothetical protein
MYRITLAVVAACLSTGCASIVSGQNQSLSVTARNNGADVTGAKCQLSNDKGTWFATTPGSIMVRRSYGDLAITCTADGAAPGLLTVKSSTKGMAFGNILFGGIIGAGVDMSTGAAYDYPALINVDLGQTATLSAPTKDAAAKPADAASAPVKSEEVAKK